MMRWMMILALVVVAASPLRAQVTFDSSFECGNGTGFALTAADTYSFQIEQDTNSDDRQWFYFEVAGAQGQTLTFRLTNAGQTNVPGHWNYARPIYSTDGGETFSLVTGAKSYTGGVFTFTHSFTADPERIAFHYPYTVTYHQQRIPQWAAHPDVTHSTIGQSVQGRDLDLLTITDADSNPEGGKMGIWIVARQHSAEVTGSWMADGFLDFVLSDDVRAQALRDRTVINIVPMVNPDGVFAGNYRDNINGFNLNRSWNDATLANDPEIVHVKNAIAAWVSGGNDYTFFADLHSTSGGRSNFAFHAGGSYAPPLYPTPETYVADSQRLLQLVQDANGDFIASQGASSSTDTRLSRQNQAAAYGVLAVLFEGTYNFTNYGPNNGQYMTPERHRGIGEAFAIALYEYYLAGAPAGLRDALIVQ